MGKGEREWEKVSKKSIVGRDLPSMALRIFTDVYSAQQCFYIGKFLIEISKKAEFCVLGSRAEKALLHKDNCG